MSLRWYAGFLRGVAPVFVNPPDLVRSLDRDTQGGAQAEGLAELTTEEPAPQPH